jgi:DNA primase
VIEESRRQMEQAQAQATGAAQQPEQVQVTQTQQVQVTQQAQSIEVPAQQTQQQATQLPQQAQVIQQPPQLPSNVIDEVNKLVGTLEAIIYDKNWNALKRVPVRDLLDALQQISDAYAIVFDGVGTQRLVDAAVSKGVKVLVMTRIGNIAKVPSDMTIATFNDVVKK